jgi:hypothetical protein
MRPHLTDKSEDLINSYKRGMQFLKARQNALPDHRARHASWSDLAKIGQDAVARSLRDKLAHQFHIDRHELLKDIQFAAAVEIIVGNCGPCSRNLMLRSRSQSRAGIMKLSRTSDARQRYRIDGLRDGRFRSVAPQNVDSVYDTVAFKEVPSRLARARGAILQLKLRLAESADAKVIAESRRLTELCLLAANQLRKLLNTETATAPRIPTYLAKDTVLPILASRDVRGPVVGMARLALRLIIKSVWDYPEMKRRGILPTAAERAKTILETKIIVAASRAIGHHE